MKTKSDRQGNIELDKRLAMDKRFTYGVKISNTRAGKRISFGFVPTLMKKLA